MRAARLLLLGHLMALVFGLGGLLIALPHPELWAGSRYAARVFTFGMSYAGSLHILLGAMTMLVFGLAVIGRRRTLIFLLAAVALSLSAELIGTGTGWPFGNYAYTTGLGYKVLGRVPFTIPLSWFYIGFAAFLLASIATSSRRHHRAPWTVAIGVYLLTVGDLVLDPAMAHPSLPIQFWVWHQSGPYFGMPVTNFAGWALTGALFMGLSRLLWGRDLNPDDYPGWLPCAVYLANLGFAIVLSLSVGLWVPVLIALALGALPALSIAHRQSRRTREPSFPAAGSTGPSRPTEVMARLAIRTSARLVSRQQMRLRTEGLESIPTEGPTLLVCRHYHHLLDGCALLTAIDRPLSFVVALDWISSARGRGLMEWACRTARWPIVLRADGLAQQPAGSGFRQSEAGHYLRSAVGQSVALLRSGQALVMFPEGYPNVDPSFTPKRDREAFLPFRDGAVRLAELAQRDGCTRVSIVPVGFAYEPDGSGVLMRVGRPMTLGGREQRAELLQAIEAEVRWLSRAVEQPSGVAREAMT